MKFKNLFRLPAFLLLVLFLFTLSFRLYFSFQDPGFSSDSAYFHLRQINHFLFQPEFLFQDPLSYGGRVVLYPPLFHLLMGVLSFGSVFLLKIIPEIFFSFLVFIIFLICREITHSNWISLFGAFISSFIPIYLTSTVNTLSVYSLALPLLFFMLYCSLRLEKPFYLWSFILSSFILSLSHPLAFLFPFILAVYFFLLAGGDIKSSPLKHEAFLFSLFLVFLIGFVIYKKAFFAYGANALWQNAPLNIFLDTFRPLSFFDLLFGVGFLPLVLGVVGLYYGLSREKRKIVYLFSALILSVFVLLFFRLMTFNLGLMILGITLSISAAFALHLFFSYLKKTKFASFHRFFVFLLLLFIVIFSFFPSYQALSSREGVSFQTLSDLEWARMHLPRDATILGNVNEGHLIASLAERKTVLDSNFLLAPSPEERLQDVYRVYSGWSSLQALDIVQKYGIDYIYLSEDSKRLYSIEGLKYINDTSCFEREGSFYAVVC